METQSIERRFPLTGIEWRESTDGSMPGQMTIAGHAAVFDRTSLPLFDLWYGEFTERIARGAFTAVLDRNPDVHFNIQHSMEMVLARTRSKTLELREDPIGLHVWARVAPTSYAQDLRILMERGDVDQASFAFSVASDEWKIENEGREDQKVTRTILEIGELYDVAVVAQGAYSSTDMGLRIREARALIEGAIATGRLPVAAGTIHRAAPDDPADASPTAPDDPADGDLARARAAQKRRRRLALIRA